MRPFWHPRLKVFYYKELKQKTSDRIIGMDYAIAKMRPFWHPVYIVFSYKRTKEKYLTRLMIINVGYM